MSFSSLFSFPEVRHIKVLGRRGNIQMNGKRILTVIELNKGSQDREEKGREEKTREGKREEKRKVKRKT